ncbi:MAG: MgtC/SapB family protein [Dehalococcoidia bacterium]|uniref:MgtC/SapB/SrpB/YhiD N-terminal domain-containing protein n=1 Tax=marine sediment metagenome TaxID=412755 RepID=X1IEE1_9ZZZZ|nr:MgtC/SapB family protein [Dehalococcoidia bacterium]TEU04388.1 MAG: MgtC/SapB family protein [Dehalococcoidia bacterium]
MSPELEMVLRLLLAVGLAALIGLERQHAGKAAGLRTHLLVCIGAALFTIASIYGFGEGGDPARVAAGIVAGIGFLGAGAIISTREGILVGLTTAASIWAVAAIGLAAGAGLYILAPVATAVVLIVLRLPKRIGGE